MNRLMTSILTMSLCALCSALPAHATNGLLSYGNGMRAHGVGGAGIADAAETMSAMDNPALAARVTGWSLGASGFNPNRYADLGNGYVESDSDFFVIPQGSWIKPVGDRFNAGVMVNVLGGINTDYPEELFGTPVGVDLASILIAPTLGYQATNQLSLGASLLIGYQQLKTNGPGVNGLPKGGDSDSALGTGLRLGAMMVFGSGTTVGFSAQTQVKFEEMAVHCDALFASASNCEMNLPEIYGIGFTQKIGNSWKLLGDIKRIEWSGVAVIDELFAWQDQTVYIVGAEYAVSDQTTVRFGYNYGESPISDDVVAQNVLAPAVSEHHLTVGFTRQRGRGEISGYLARVLNNEQNQAGAGIPRVRMDQNAFGLSYALTFR